MRMKRNVISLVLLLLSVTVGYAQENFTEICVDFRVNSKTIDTSFSDNGARMEEMISFLRNLRQDSTVRITEVSFSGAASPEGSYQINRRLANGRLASLEKRIRQEVEIPDSIIQRNDEYIPWDYLRSLIEDSDLTHKQEIIDILDDEAKLVSYQGGTHIDHRIPRLKAIDGGRVWQEINRKFFSKMRNACVLVVTYKKEMPPVPEPEPVMK